MAEKRITMWVQRFPDRKHLVLQWHDPETGKRKSKSAKTADDKKAEEARGDLESDLNNGRYAEASRMTWECFRELFEAEYVAPLRPATRDNFGDTLNTFEELCHPKQLAAITTRTISAFAAAMRKKPVRGREGMKPGTVKVRLQFLRTALRWAVEQELLPKCPKFPVVKVPDRKPQAIPVESFGRLLDKAPDHQTRVYLLAGWLAGLRLSEAYLLEWEPTEEAPYVDFGANRIILPAGFVKGVRDQWVPLDPVLREALLSLPRQGQRVFHFLDTRKGQGNRPITTAAMSDRVSRLAHKAGVRLTMHSLRKGFGCRYAGKVPAQVLQKLMRHASIRTTMDFYANVDNAVMEAVLGTQGGERNSSRNTTPAAADKRKDAQPTTPSGDTTCASSHASR